MTNDGRAGDAFVPPAGTNASACTTFAIDVHQIFFDLPRDNQ